MLRWKSNVTYLGSTTPPRDPLVADAPLSAPGILSPPSDANILQMLIIDYAVRLLIWSNSTRVAAGQGYALEVGPICRLHALLTETKPFQADYRLAMTTGFVKLRYGPVQGLHLGSTLVKIAVSL